MSLSSYANFEEVESVECVCDVEPGSHPDKVKRDEKILRRLLKKSKLGSKKPLNIRPRKIGQEDKSEPEVEPETERKTEVEPEIERKPDDKKYILTGDISVKDIPRIKASTILQVGAATIFVIVYFIPEDDLLEGDLGHPTKKNGVRSCKEEVMVCRFCISIDGYVLWKNYAVTFRKISKSESVFNAFRVESPLQFGSKESEKWVPLKDRYVPSESFSAKKLTLDLFTFARLFVWGDREIYYLM